ncbi:SLAC1 anion channel family protein [Thiolapillus brandeum]|uniref:Tellurite resistance/dicarboxylate transporter, TDT family n=1 Tax=Thiolapillus brandeum TaxID=1076588 RepID=A0A7U6GIB9_9GAMM|nr:SLAC1 anion channel family protein [Thiolapillus brandeum]BAO44179.1 tellurite resistance/dicarboxylate transporter, TDT family [Thiolapillus brandeum]
MSTSRIENFPVSFFSMIMGMAGLAIAWEKAHQILEINPLLSHALLLATGAVFVVLIFIYSIKILRYRQSVSAELHNPIKLNFFPAVSISLLLISIALLPIAPRMAEVLWGTGVGLHFLLTLYVMRVWIHHEHFEIHHINPAWFIPVVGNVLVPIAGTHLGYYEISWFFFSIGIVFWIVLFTIIFYRVLFHPPMPAKLLPTLFILIAPPAVGFLSYIALTGEQDAFGRVLYYAALFLTILLVTQAGFFARLKFSLSWWAYSFPLAAMTIATLKMFELTGKQGFYYMGWGFLGLISLVVLFLLLKTFSAIGRHNICTPEA